MDYKELIADPWYASVIVFVTQIIFFYLRTINVLYTSSRNVWGAIWTGTGVSLFWLVSMSIGLNSMISGAYQPIVSFILGGALGTYFGIKKDKQI